MTSWPYAVYSAAMRMFPVKRFLNKDGAAFDTMVRKFGNHQKAKGPSRKLMQKYAYQSKQLGGRPCYIVRPHNHKLERAVLLFFGGGYLMPPDQGDFSFAGEIAEQTGSDVYFPLYPLAPQYKLIMISPGLQMPPSEAQLERMRKLEKADATIPISFCRNIHRVLVDKDSAYLLRTFDTPWSGLPQMIFFFGGRELFRAYIPDIEQAAEAGKVKIRIHVGENMAHCWPMLRFTREAGEARAELYEIIRTT